ncbi:MAG: DUF1648 domain-containing protein [Paraclostridium sp.]|uniref:DUF1648 domain-containing protein n=1 Tax=Paraclostridium sp. TaxID=2023273 RepID=UPI003F2F1B55
MNYKFEFDTKQKVIELINLLILCFMIGYLIVNWNNIGDTVPSHYNFTGHIDSWGDKGTLILLPILAVLVNCSMGITLFIPQSLNIPVKVTEQNYAKVYDLTRYFISFVKTSINVSFFYITIMSANSKPLGSLFLPMFLILIFLPIILYYVKIRKLK